MSRTLTTVVELRLRTTAPAAWRKADQIIAAIAAVPGVTAVDTKDRSDRDMALNLAVRLNASSKGELRKLYAKVTRIADTSVLRLVGRGCILNEMF